MEKTVIRRLTIAYYAVIVLCLLLVTTLIYLNKLGRLSFIDPMTTLGQTVQTIVILYLIVSLPLVLFWFKKMCDKLKSEADETVKFKGYQKYSKIRLIVVGVGLLVAITSFYLLGGHQPMIWCAAIEAIGLIFCKPSQNRMILELNNITE